jgi:hypothetical protein
VPVVVHKPGPGKGPTRTPDAAAEPSGASGLPQSVSTPAFVAVIVVVLAIVVFVAFRVFGPTQSWDNNQQGSRPTASSLSAPPAVARTGEGAKADGHEDMVGAEMPPGSP